jgi:hypothetical protein
MANTNAPFGLVAIGTSDGSDYHGKIRAVAFLAGDSVACFVGDPVKLTGATTTDGKLEVVATSTTAVAIAGVFVGFQPDFTNEGNLTNNHRLASTAVTGYVLFGSDVLYTCQEDSDAGAIPAAESGFNVDLIYAAGNTLTGTSAVELDSSTALAASGQFRLRSISQQIDNEIGVNAKWVVSINENQDDHGAGIT